jgi:hypothetical protein
MDAKRKALADDWTGGEYAFAIGTLATYDEFCPLDKIAVKFCGGEAKELKDGLGEPGLTLAEDKGKELGEKIWTALKKLHEDFKKEKDSDKKAYGKYTAKDAFAQIDEAVGKWCAKSGLEHKLEGEAPATAPAGMEGEMAMGEAMEGGMDMMEGDMMMMAAAAPKREAPDFDSMCDAEGPTEIPKILLAMYVAYPVFGDAVKAQVLDHEFGGSGSDDLGVVATILCGFVDAQEKAEAESWGCAWCTADELEELKNLDKEKSALVFPGTVVAWDSKDTAVGNAGEKPEGKNKVMFQFTNTKHFAKDKAHIVHRAFAKVKEVKEEDGGTLVVLEDFADEAFKTVAAWSEKVKVLAAAAGAAGEAVADAAKDAMMMEPEMMMMDPPME